jgi:hypothetical protein
MDSHALIGIVRLSVSLIASSQVNAECSGPEFVCAVVRVDFVQSDIAAVPMSAKNLIERATRVRALLSCPDFAN